MEEYLKATPDGVMLPILAIPGSRRNEIGPWHDGCLKVAVTQIAEGGKANKAIVNLLSKMLGLNRSQLTLVTGETSRRKMVRVTAISAEELSKAIRLCSTSAGGH